MIEVRLSREPNYLLHLRWYICLSWFETHPGLSWLDRSLCREVLVEASVEAETTHTICDGMMKGKNSIDVGMGRERFCPWIVVT